MDFFHLLLLLEVFATVYVFHNQHKMEGPPKDVSQNRCFLDKKYKKYYNDCRFSYVENWELVKSIVGTKF